ncbi:hypothetical protein ACQPZF_16465 [Actinosynnema sp. CS-041913]|uniref:hypothetical protein n=1 Tax=Actinosynnema sp. CS-041913 TaxID=3239917 RepID=UPI003D8AABBF
MTYMYRRPVREAIVSHPKKEYPMYVKPVLLKMGSFERLTMHSRPVAKDRAHRRRPRHVLI